MANMVIASTTSSQAELEHAMSDEYRNPAALDDFNKPAEEKPVEEVAAEPEEKEEEKPAPPKGHKGGGADKRIGKLTAMLAAANRENEELKAKVKPAEEKVESTAPREPKLAEYGNDVEKWTAARDQWKENEVVRLANEENQKAIWDEYVRKRSEARAEYDDWDAVVKGASDSVKIPQAAEIAIYETENGPEIAYYLAKHPEEAAAMLELRSVHAIHVAVDRISTKLLAEKTEPVVKAKVRPPEPVTPVGSSAARTNVPLDELSPREYIRVMNKRERENRGR